MVQGRGNPSQRPRRTLAILSAMAAGGTDMHELCTKGMQGLIGSLADSGSSHSVRRGGCVLSPEAGEGAWHDNREDRAWDLRWNCETIASRAPPTYGSDCGSEEHLQDWA